MTGDGARKTIKCVVWDLDDTVWDGVLLEGGDVILRPEVRGVIQELDQRGILNSIASRNDHELAMAKLVDFQLQDYFLYPQIGWGSKSSAIRTVARSLNIGTDAIAFIDDEPYERDEVSAELPEVLCMAPGSPASLLGRPELTPRFVTADSRWRRRMYLADSARAQVAESFVGPKEEFLRSLGMRLEIARAVESDLQRAEELTVRTHLLNTTGYVYSYDELNALRTSEDHLLLIARLTDRYGPYGTIGLGLVDKEDTRWTVKLLLLSCRVAARGIATVFVNHLKRLASDAGVRLQAEMVPTRHNRLMYLSFVMNRFRVLQRSDGLIRLEADPADIPEDPSYVDVTADL